MMNFLSLFCFTPSSVVEAVVDSHKAPAIKKNQIGIHGLSSINIEAYRRHADAQERNAEDAECASVASTISSKDYFEDSKEDDVEGDDVETAVTEVDIPRVC